MAKKNIDLAKSWVKTAFPKIVLQRTAMKLPDLAKKHSLPKVKESLKVTNKVIKVECTEENGKRARSTIRQWFETGGQKKFFGKNSQLLWLGIYGPRKDNLEANIDRTYELKASRSCHIFYKSVVIKGLHIPYQEAQSQEVR